VFFRGQNAPPEIDFFFRKESMDKMGMRIKARRIARGWTREQLVDEVRKLLVKDECQYLFFTKRDAAQLEDFDDGSVAIGVLSRIAKLFNTTAAYLIKGDEKYLHREDV